MARYRHRWLGLALAAAIAFSALLPFFAVYTPPAVPAQAKALYSLFGEKIFICTGDGFKWVKLSDLQSGKEKPKPHSDTKCPLCYVARHGLGAAPAAPLAIAQDRRRTVTSVAAAYDSLLDSFPPASPPNVRAPPFSLIG